MISPPTSIDLVSEARDGGDGGGGLSVGGDGTARNGGSLEPRWKIRSEPAVLEGAGKEGK